MGVAAAVIGGAVIAGGATIYAAKSAAGSADQAYAGADAAARLQHDIAQQQQDLANEQWTMYKDNIYPLELEAQQLGLDYQKLSFQQYKDYYKPLGDQFAQEAMEGVEADPERAAREARLSVDQQFDTEEGMMQRNLERRGVRPGSGNYESGIADTSLSRAAAKGFTVNRAVEAERDRVEDVNFNRKAVALGRSPVVGGGAPGLSSGAASYGLAAAGNTAQGAGAAYGNIANTYGNAASGIVSGGIQLGTAAYDLYNKYNTPAAPPPATYTGGTAGVSSDVGFNPTSMDLTGGFAEGGEVNVPPTLGRGGQVNGPPGRDMVPAYVEAQDGTRAPTRLTDNEFVIPADVVAAVGTDTLDDIIESARMRRQKTQQGPNTLTRRIN